MSSEKGTMPKRVLIIEDSPEDREIYRRLLSRALPDHYIISEAENGDDGMEIVAATPPEVILLDLNLPDTDGFALLKELQLYRDKLDIGVVMLTGQGNEEIAVEAMKHGADEYLGKGSLTPAILHHAIQNAGGKASLHRALAKSQAEMEAFASVAAHDLRAPLRHIGAFSKRLGQTAGERLTESDQLLLQKIEEKTKQMNQLVDDLLQYARNPDADHDSEMIDLNAIAQQAVQNLQILIDETSAKVNLCDLPTIPGYRTNLLQLFQNVIGNALKFRSDEPPLINLTMEQGKDRIKIAVQDNGIGIAQKYHQQIFVPLRRLHGRAEYEGTGLGLATCQKAVERHGGEIWVESEGEGMGSTILFTLSTKID